MKLIKIKETNEIKYILDSELNLDIHYDYTNSIFHWGNNEVTDYVLQRKNIKRITESVDFNILDDEEKEIVISYCATTGESIVGYYMGQGMTQEQAQQQYGYNRIIDIQNAAKCYCVRKNKPELQLNIIFFLGEEQGANLNQALLEFTRQLCDIALLGTSYNDSQDGIMDFIESTGGYTDGGLKAYTYTDNVVTKYGSQEGARLALVSIFQFYLINGGY